MNKITISLLLVCLLSACASTTQKNISGTGKAGGDAAKSSESSTKSTQSSTAPSASRSAASASSSLSSPDSLNDTNSILSKRSVYYPFDVSVVQVNDKPIVEAHAKYLSKHPEQKVRLEGNCDERGSNEYNLALGQRRADSVKKLLQAGGVKDNQISTISYGEEKPKSTGHDETSWSQNRRTDLNYNAH